MRIIRTAVLLPIICVCSGILMERAPVFKSIPTTVKTYEHDTVLLPCYVQNQGTNKVKWWRGEELLAMSHPSQVFVDNIAVLDNNTLQVSDIGLKDVGSYTCQVIREPPWGPINQTHDIVVLIPPTAKMYPDNFTVEVEQYDELVLNCSVTGEPAPLITWTFNGEEIQLLTQRNTFHLTASSGKLSGEYACIANNGVGALATASIHVTVIYPPVVTAPKIWIHSAPGIRTDIHCDVDACPRAKVQWFKDKQPLITGGRIVTYKRGNKHGLSILSTKRSDFGYYTCLASNVKGTSQQVILVTGVPDVPKFKENYFQRDERNVSLAWQVDSFSPIIQYNLLFREYSGNEKPDSWTKLVIPADIFSTGPLHDQTYTLTGLGIATAYESTVAARNIFGWSKPSSIFRFATIGADLEPHATTVGEAETNMIGDYMSVEYVTLGNVIVNSSSLVQPINSLIVLLLIAFSL